MNLLSIDHLRELVEQSPGICVSIYMPTYKAGPETQQNPIRFKNLLREAAAKLEELGVPDPAHFLRPTADITYEDWQHQDEGLVIFLAEGFFRTYRLPIKFDELVVVSEQFHLKPMMPLLTTDSEFYILALSQQEIRFFEATRYGITEVNVEGMPKSMADALQYDETAKAGQFRSSTSRGGTANAAQQAGTFHGQGSPDRDDIKQDILQYFHIVDRSLHDYLRDKWGPLVLVGVEYLLPIYREASHYGNLLDEGVTENPENQKPEALHDRAWPIVEPYFFQAEQMAIEHYQEMAAIGKTSTDPKEVIPAAYFGRVEQLFVAIGLQQWGHFDPQAMELQMHSAPEVGDEDLLNVAAIQTLLNGGRLYAVAPEQVPDTAPLAAVFRY